MSRTIGFTCDAAAKATMTRRIRAARLSIDINYTAKFEMSTCLSGLRVDDGEGAMCIVGAWRKVIRSTR